MKNIEFIIRKTYKKEISGFINVLLRRDVNKLLHKPFVITQLQLSAVGFVCRFAAYSYVFYTNNLQPPECTFYDLSSMYYYGINKFGKQWKKIVGKIEARVSYYLNKYVSDVIKELQNCIKLYYKEQSINFVYFFMLYKSTIIYIKSVLVFLALFFKSLVVQNLSNYFSFRVFSEGMVRLIDINIIQYLL